jgi:hypothetical protein
MMPWWRQVNWTLIALTVAMFVGAVLTVIIIAKVVGLI